MDDTLLENQELIVDTRAADQARMARNALARTRTATSGV